MGLMKIGDMPVKEFLCGSSGVGDLASLPDLVSELCNLGPERYYYEFPSGVIADSEMVIGSTRYGTGVGLMVHGKGLLRTSSGDGIGNPISVFALKGGEHVYDSVSDFMNSYVTLKDDQVYALLEERLPDGMPIRVMGYDEFMRSANPGVHYAVVMDEYQARSAAEREGSDLRNKSLRNPLLNVKAGGRENLESFFEVFGDALEYASPGRSLYQFYNYTLPKAALIGIEGIWTGMVPFSEKAGFLKKDPALESRYSRVEEV